MNFYFANLSLNELHFTNLSVNEIHFAKVGLFFLPFQTKFQYKIETSQLKTKQSLLDFKI